MAMERNKDEKNPCQGTLNKSKQKRTENSPDMWGYLKIDGFLLNFIQEEMAKGNDLPEIRLIGWKKEGKWGSFISLLADIKDVQGPMTKPAYSGARSGPSGGGARYTPRARNTLDDGLPF